jgi:hypothetical protein
MRHAARQLPSWLIFDVRQYPILSGRSRFEERSEMKHRDFEAGRVKSSTPAKAAILSSTRIGVRGFDDSVLALSARLVGRANVSVACGALKS